MSYMRGTCYIWRDDTRVHIWAEDGYDRWDDTSWAEGRKHGPTSDPPQAGGASGVGIRQEIANAYVVMRLAELVAEQRIDAVVEFAVANLSGNGGCLALQKLRAALVGRLESIASDPAAAEIRELWNKTTGDCVAASGTRSRTREHDPVRTNRWALCGYALESTSWCWRPQCQPVGTGDRV